MKDHLPDHLQRAMELAGEMGASTLTALPLQVQGFKLEFQEL